MDESLRKEISDLVSKERVVLFMKGTRQMPSCGFSAQVVHILDELLPAYHTVDVLRSPELRDSIKEFSQWPTIPQLYVAGQFVGGCDIVRDLHASGELAKLLGVDATAAEPPSITIRPGAARAFEAAAADSGGEPLHFRMDAGFHYDLYFGPPEPGEIEVRTNAMPLLLDGGSIRRAGGTTIDFVEGPGGGFKIHNPAEPPKVKQISAAELKAMLDRREVTLFDVRPDRERALAMIADARALDPQGQAHLMSLDREAPIAFHCHHGGRSQAAAEQMLREGFKKVYNLQGGIDAWSTAIDPSVPRY